MRKALTLALSALFAIAAFAAPTGLKLLKEIKIGGEGGWDYLTMDSSARRLYVSHATHVVVVDPDAGKVVGDIPDTPGVHGIALAPNLNRGFISNGRSNNSTAIDAKTGMAVATIPMGGKPEFAVADDKGHVYVNIEDTSEIVEIDAAKAAVTKRYSLKPCDGP